jgi:hypothetical protein
LPHDGNGTKPATDDGASVGKEDRREKYKGLEQNSKKEFNRAARSSSRVKRHFKEDGFPAQRRQFELEFRNVASLAV